jgi:serine/threonine-protein kinase
MTEALGAMLAQALADRYRIERELGRGGMATVYLARDLKHDRLVALKVLHPDLAATLGPERFQREIRFAARLQHPHVLTVLDSGEAAGHLWFTMPYVEGESLRDRLVRDRQLPIEDALRIAREAAQALHYAHEHGVLHRDVKPENILLTKDGNTLVADFGVARAMVGDESLTQTGLAVGTPAYMSPEQAAGERTIDARSDVYALGCVLYEMLAGEPPFTGPTAQAVIAKRFNTPVTPLRVTRPDMPVEVDQATLRALARTPADRFATAADFSQSLRVGGATPTGTLITRTSTTSSRRRLRVLVGLGLLLTVGAGAAWLKARVPTPVPADSSAFAVLPFRAVGPGLELWREGLVDLLAINLDGAGGLRAIPPRTVLSRWHREIGDGEVDEEQALAVARGVGARYALTGSIVGTGPSLRLTAELRDLQANRLAGRAQAEGPGDSVPAMVDRLTLQLLSAGLPGAGSGYVTRDLGGATTRSLPALKHFLVGERLFRGGLADSALAEYRAAVAADSDFALGAYRLVVAKSWTFSPHYVDNYPAEDLPRLSRLADRLPPREAAVTAAIPLLVRAEPAALPMLARLVDRHPRDAEAWFQYGDALFHLGGAAGEPRQKFRDALRRATELDPGLAFAYVHLAEDAFDRRDSAEVARIVAALRRTDAGSPKTTGFALAEQEVWGDEAARAGVRAALDTASAAALLTAKHALDLTPDLEEPALVFARALADQPRFSAKDRANGYGGMHYVFLGVGHLRQAKLAADSSLILQGIGHWAGILRGAFDLWQQLHGVDDSARAEAAYAQLASHDSMRVYELQVPQVMGLYAATRGRLRQVDQWIAVLEHRASEMEDSAGAALLRTDIGLIKAFVAEARGDRGAVLPALRVAADRYPVAELFPEGGLLRLELARRLLAEGDYRGAERYLGSFDIGTYYFWLTPGVVELYRGQAAEGLGEVDRARRHYGNVVRWLADSDPELVPLRERAREALARLSAEPAERT